MKHKPITFTRTGITGEDIEIEDGYETLYDDFDEDYPDDTESRSELLKIISETPYYHSLVISEETGFGILKSFFFKYIEEKVFDVEFTDKAKAEISTVGQLIDYLISQNV